MSIITTILLIALLLLTLYRWTVPLFYGPLASAGFMGLDFFLLPCWMGFGLYHLF